MQPTVLELNATHTAITCITNQLETDGRDKGARDVLPMRWDMELLSSGFSLCNASRLHAVINLMFAIAPDVVGQTEELSLIVDFKMFSFPCFPFEDRMDSGRSAGTWFIDGTRTFAGAIRNTGGGEAVILSPSGSQRGNTEG
jgi:hypothetical protein